MNPPEHLSQPGCTEAVLAGLNPAQREAVTHGRGPLLVLAGAGSGKTRVITQRIAHLVLGEGVSPSRVVAVTFTNKAAAEMRERVERILGSDLGGWIGTFHSLCLRLLRYEGSRIGLKSGFNIYDRDDQLVLVKRILKEEAAADGEATPRAMLGRISRCKNSQETPEDVARRAFSPERKLLAGVYRQYQEALHRANAVDFDDLLLRTLELFDRHPDVARAYASRCEHLLVDEYQDTNRPQYLLVRHLSSVHGNVCVVGDEDQSIYRFRGAEIRNILEFEADHPGTRVIRLEQNYRSSGTIIAAATALISNNVRRKGKTLWTDNAPGDKVELFRAPDDRFEAAWIAEKVREMERDLSHQEMAVLYRTNAQSRQLEEIFRREKIPHQVVGSLRFYERKEIKDLLAYLKLLSNPADDVSFRRVVNTPPRGIGNTTLARVEEVARQAGLPLMEAAGLALEQELLPPRSARRLQEFADLVSSFVKRAEEIPADQLLTELIEETRFAAYLEKLHAGVGAERMENARALISAAAEYGEEAGPEAGLEGFLDRSALVSDADEVGTVPGVTLTTVHCAKGLEFPVVFVAGLEESLFPHAMSAGSEEDLEEERRLCYVAMTRAKRRLFLAHAHHRRLQGAFLPSRPSRFLDEIPEELLRETAPREQGFFARLEARGPAESSSWGGSSAARAASRRASAPRRAVQRGVDPGDGFAVGALVLHPRFGGGTILDREGKGKHLKLTIDFSDHGPKKILPAYTKLQVQVS